MAKDMLVRAAAARWKVAPAACKAANGVVTHGKDRLTLRRARRGRDEAAAAGDREAQGAEGLEADRHRRPPARHAGEDHRQGAVRHRRPVPRAAHRRRRAAAGVRREARQVRRGRGAQGARRREGRADRERRRRRRRRTSGPRSSGATRSTIEWTQARGRRRRHRQAARRASARCAKTTGAIVADVGKVDAALDRARSASSTPQYEVPYLAHAPMEPLNCTVKIDGDHVRDLDRHAIPDRRPDGRRAGSSGITPDKVTIHTTFLGGGFGRRANPAIGLRRRRP